MFNIVKQLTHPLILCTKLTVDQLPFSVQTQMQFALKAKSKQDKKSVKGIYCDSAGAAIIKYLHNNPEEVYNWEESAKPIVASFDTYTQCTVEVILEVNRKLSASPLGDLGASSALKAGRLSLMDVESELQALFNVDKIPGIVIDHVIARE